MAKPPTKSKTATPIPPATTPEKRILKPHELVISPTVQSAIAIEAWSKFAGTVDLADLLDDLRDRIKKVQGGDMQPVEAMLFGQAMTLETIFTSLARRATSQEYLNQFQAYLGMALKAQAQCRATLEALADAALPVEEIERTCAAEVARCEAIAGESLMRWAPWSLVETRGVH